MAHLWLICLVWKEETATTLVCQGERVLLDPSKEHILFQTSLILNRSWMLFFSSQPYGKVMRSRVPTWFGETVQCKESCPLQISHLQKNPTAPSSCLKCSRPDPSRENRLCPFRVLFPNLMSFSPPLRLNILLLTRLRKNFQVKQGRGCAVLSSDVFLLFWPLQSARGPWWSRQWHSADVRGEVREANNTAHSPLLLKQSKRERPVSACVHARVCVCMRVWCVCLLFYEKFQLARKLWAIIAFPRWRQAVCWDCILQAHHLLHQCGSH